MDFDCILKFNSETPLKSNSETTQKIVMTATELDLIEASLCPVLRAGGRERILTVMCSVAAAPASPVNVEPPDIAFGGNPLSIACSANRRIGQVGSVAVYCGGTRSYNIFLYSSLSLGQVLRTG